MILTDPSSEPANSFLPPSDNEIAQTTLSNSSKQTGRLSIGFAKLHSRTQQSDCILGSLADWSVPVPQYSREPSGPKTSARTGIPFSPLGMRAARNRHSTLQERVFQISTSLAVAQLSQTTAVAMRSPFLEIAIDVTAPCTAIPIYFTGGMGTTFFNVCVDMSHKRRVPSLEPLTRISVQGTKAMEFTSASCPFMHSTSRQVVVSHNRMVRSHEPDARSLLSREKANAQTQF